MSKKSSSASNESNKISLNKSVANSLVKPNPKVVIQAYQPPPKIREVRALANVESRNELVITGYKDLSDGSRAEIDVHGRQFVIAILVFFLLGVGIFMGSQANKSRGLASTFESPAGVVTNDEHYHYDKSCYKGEKGEQICMTRTSRK